MEINRSIVQKPYILIVDDDEDDHHFLNTAIQDVLPGANVRSLFDGTEAIALLKNELEKAVQLPDLIFLDLNMNKACGKKTTSILKKDKQFRHIPIVILTTASCADQKREVLGLGAEDFYTKPNNIHELKKIVIAIKDKWL